MKIFRLWLRMNRGISKFWIALAISCFLHVGLILWIYCYWQTPVVSRPVKSPMQLSLSHVINQKVTPEIGKKEAPTPKKSTDKPAPKHNDATPKKLEESISPPTEKNTPQESFSEYSHSLTTSMPNELSDNVWLSKLYSAIEKHKKYPKNALRMKIEGEVLVEFELRSNGEFLGAKIIHSSGHAILDKHALEVLQKASFEFPLPQQNIRIKVPIIYKLL